MTDHTDDSHGLDAGLPAWAAAVVMRLEFFHENRHPEQLAALMSAVEPLRALTSNEAANARTLDRFMHACLDLFGGAIRRHAELAPVIDELDALCGLARKALATDRDDRPLLVRTQVLMDMPGLAGRAAPVPGRVVFLAAMVAHVPDEVGAAATMLTNDLATVGVDLPLRALQVAIKR